jgi:hypothetical protein
MKKVCLLVVLQMVIFVVAAQNNEPIGMIRPEPVNPLKDKLDYAGYTIRLFPARPMPGSRGGYGFDIVKGNRPVVHLEQANVPFLPKGIQKKLHAFTIAKWMIQEYNKSGHWNNTIPPHIAHELKISN